MLNISDELSFKQLQRTRDRINSMSVFSDCSHEPIKQLRKTHRFTDNAPNYQKQKYKVIEPLLTSCFTRDKKYLFQYDYYEKRITQCEFPKMNTIRTQVLSYLEYVDMMSVSDDSRKIAFGQRQCYLYFAVANIDQFFDSGLILYLIKEPYCDLFHFRFTYNDMIMMHYRKDQKYYLAIFREKQVANYDTLEETISLSIDQLLPTKYQINWLLLQSFEIQGYYLLKIQEENKGYNLKLFDPLNNIFIDDPLHQGEKFDIYFNGTNMIIDFDREGNFTMHEIRLKQIPIATPQENSENIQREIIEYQTQKIDQLSTDTSQVSILSLQGDILCYCLSYDEFNHTFIEYNISTSKIISKSSIVSNEVSYPMTHITMINFFEANNFMILQRYMGSNAEKLNFLRRSNICNCYFKQFFPVRINPIHKVIKDQNMIFSVDFFDRIYSREIQCQNIIDNKTTVIQFDGQLQIISCFYLTFLNSVLIYYKDKGDDLFKLKLKSLQGSHDSVIFESANKYDIYIMHENIDQSQLKMQCAKDKEILLNLLFIYKDFGYQIRQIELQKKQTEMYQQWLEYDYPDLVSFLLVHQDENQKLISSILFYNYEGQTVKEFEVKFENSDLIISRILEINEDSNIIICEVEDQGNKHKLIKFDYSLQKIIDQISIFDRIFEFHEWLIAFKYDSEIQVQITLITKESFQTKVKMKLNPLIVDPFTNKKINFQNLVFQQDRLAKNKFTIHCDRIDNQVYSVNIFEDHDSIHSNFQHFLTYIPYSDYQFFIDESGTYEFYNSLFRTKKICMIKVYFLEEDLKYCMNANNLSDLVLIVHLRQNDIQRYLVTYYPYYSSFLHQIALRPLVLQEFISQIQYLDKDNIPLLLSKDRSNLTPFDIAIMNNQAKSISLMIDMMIRYQENTFINHIFDKNLCTLLERGYDLKEYFMSGLPVYVIQEPGYPNLHFDQRTQIFNCEASDPFELLTKEAYQKNIGYKMLQSTRKRGVYVQSAIEYLLINMPETLQSRKLMPILKKSNKLELFETLCLRTIIDYKWKNYTFWYYFKQFVIFLIFIVIFLTDLYYTLYLDINGADFDYISLAFKTAGLLILSYFVQYEITSALRSGPKYYFSDPWNLFDFLLISLYMLIAIIEFFSLLKTMRNILLCGILLLAFIKLNFFLRIFDGFSFMVSMMQGVFSDLKFFVAYFMITVFEFGVLFTILVQNSDFYESIGGIGYFIMAFRTSLGDFDLDLFEENAALEIITSRWIISIVGVFILNIVFMNVIIAVISESYEKVMQKVIAQSYKVKVDMIVERELHFNDEDFMNKTYFPAYLILRRPHESTEENALEWQGFIRDLKLSVAKNVADSNYEMQQKLDVIQKETVGSIKKMEEKFITHQKESEHNFKSLEHKFSEQEKILSNIEQLLMKNQQVKRNNTFK